MAGLAGGLVILAAILRGFRTSESVGGETAIADPAGASRYELTGELAAQVRRIEEREAQVARTVWAAETAGRQYGQILDDWWDAIRRATNRLEALAGLAPAEVVLPIYPSAAPLAHGLEFSLPHNAGRRLAREEWKQAASDLAEAGWRLDQFEIRHIRFTPGSAPRGPESLCYFSAHLENISLPARASLEGELVVSWATPPDGDPVAAPLRVDGSRLALLTRSGEPPFQVRHSEKIPPPEHAHSIDPLLVRDLDGDGRAEIVLAGKNLVWRRNPEGGYESRPLLPGSPDLLSVALLEDFDGDGRDDFLALRREGLFLHRGTAGGGYRPTGELCWSAPADLKQPMAMTAGDIDADGDLDVFIAQYRIPYELGSMPTPFYNANDGYPAYLLVNDGRGRMTDRTPGSGLEPKRHRRTYACSFADLNLDGHLDLIVVSDFAGADVYHGDGRGRFTDETARSIHEPEAFGMALAVNDFNRDGRLDLLMMGMTSPTADRLEALGLWRNPREDRRMRARMTFGNRLLLAGGDGAMRLTDLSRSIARSGWSWGCAVADFDRDSFPDVFVANGLESGETVRDYESEYWLHDQFVGDSREIPAAYFYFKAKFGRTRGVGHSYGGHERDRLFLNLEGARFLDAGYVLGASFPFDSRNAVAADLTGNGRPDLVTTGFDAWPEAQQTLRVIENRFAATGHWIGFDLSNTRGGRSPCGATVILMTSRGKYVQQVVCGDSYRSQSPPVVHFGLGELLAVESAEIRWVGAPAVTISHPAINRYHRVTP